MFKLAFVGTVAAYVSAKHHPINHDIVKEIKQKATTWVPHEVEENPLRHRTIEQIEGLLGDNGVSSFVSSTTKKNVNQELTSTPLNFDTRTAFGDCVHPIRDQKSCGSCWAFGSSEALSDRFCVASNGKVNVVLSPENLVDCDHANSGCNGGWIGDAFNYFEKTGIVADTCYPYTAGNGVEGTCAASCVNSSDSFTRYRCAPNSVVHLDDPELIKSALVQGGPLATRFDVYSDFMSYKGGIYKHVTGGRNGGHAVKLVGYGVSGGDKYWIIANSWGPAWGENGFFRIAWGECGINDNVFGCTPLLSNGSEEVSTQTIPAPKHHEDEIDVKIVTMKSNKIPAPIGPYTAGKEITANGSILAYSSGQIGLTAAGVLVSGTVVDQAEQALTNIKNLAQDNGLTLDDAIKTTVYLTDMGDFDAVNAVYAKYFTSNFPARTCVAVAALPKGAKVEVEAIFFRA